MFIDQISIFIENRQGRMAEITKLLADGGIDIRALSIADTTDYGILRLIVNNPEKATELLKENHVTATITKVLAIAIDDKPGGLNKAITILSEKGVDVEYMYAFLNPRKDTAFVILRVADNEKAVAILKDGGIELMSNADIQ